MTQIVLQKQSVTYSYSNLELLSKDEVFHLLSFLTEKINRSFIMMGGLLYLIRKNKWFDSHATFADFCDSYVGLQYRKSMYLIQVYESLIVNHIPFEEVSALGFTKLTLLSTHFTETNYKNLIAWATDLTTQQIEDELKLTFSKSKEFIDKVKGIETLSPDYKETKFAPTKPVFSDLKQLIISYPIELVIAALNSLNPDKEFVLG